jgi:hypothetical protein
MRKIAVSYEEVARRLEQEAGWGGQGLKPGNIGLGH